MHFAFGVNYNAYDLGGAIKGGEGKMHEKGSVPCSMAIVYNQLSNPQYTNTIIFVSNNPVLLVDGTISRVAILMALCDDIGWIVNKNKFSQGELCYYEVTYQMLFF